LEGDSVLTINANEADVRDEIATPFLKALGYESGTENDILRERTLSYHKAFLGRKNENDPILRGRFDYVLAVTGAGRWVLELKAPTNDITQDDIDQSISYARHPEVAARYACVTNGKRLVVYHSDQPSTVTPTLDLVVSNPFKLAEDAACLLSPASIRRDCIPPIVDTGLPLAEGFRSSALIIGGSIEHHHFEWQCNVELPADAKASLNETCRVLVGRISAITGGKIWRDENSRIHTKLEWAMPHEILAAFAERKRLQEMEYISLSSVISNNPEEPTNFDAIGNVSIVEGEQLFDIVRWRTTQADMPSDMSIRGQAIGYMNASVFNGEYQTEYEITYPAMPSVMLKMYGIGKVTVSLDPR